MTPLDLAFKTVTGGAVPSRGYAEFNAEQTQERTLYVDANDARALIEPTRDGHDYIRICARHQWAAEPVVLFADLGDCPVCVAEADRDGRRRYAALHAANVRIVGTV